MSTKRYKNEVEKTPTKRCKTTKMRQKVQRYSKLSNYSNKNNCSKAKRPEGDVKL